MDYSIHGTTDTNALIFSTFLIGFFWACSYKLTCTLSSRAWVCGLENYCVRLLKHRSKAAKLRWPPYTLKKIKAWLFRWYKKKKKKKRSGPSSKALIMTTSNFGTVISWQFLSFLWGWLMQFKSRDLLLSQNPKTTNLSKMAPVHTNNLLTSLQLDTYHAEQQKICART